MFFFAVSSLNRPKPRRDERSVSLYFNGFFFRSFHFFLFFIFHFLCWTIAILSQIIITMVRNYFTFKFFLPILLYVPPSRSMERKRIHYSALCGFINYFTMKHWSKSLQTGEFQTKTYKLMLLFFTFSLPLSLFFLTLLCTFVLDIKFQQLHVL